MKKSIYLLQVLFVTVAIFYSSFSLQAQKVTDPADTNPFYHQEKSQVVSNSAIGNSFTKYFQNTLNLQKSQSKSGGEKALCNDPFIPRDGTYTAVPRNDDGSFGPLNLGFDFELCGGTYSQVWINTNGNLSFNSDFSGFDPTALPVGFPFVAPFWADMDTRNAACGQIWYKLEADHLIVTWENVGYYNQNCSLVNTFQAIISDGNAVLIGVGNNVQYRYGDMQWTTGDASEGVNGFGGDPATVGFDSGFGNFTQDGRFDHAGNDYDGGFGNNDGVDFLDNNCFDYSTGGNDNDGDGFDECEDCDDNDSSVYPGAPELCDGLDNDCNNIIDDVDLDGDGFSAMGACSGSMDDCDDNDPNIYPGAPEQCNGIDDDCDGILPIDELDNDGDGQIACRDCDDTDPDITQESITQSNDLTTITPGLGILCTGVENSLMRLFDGTTLPLTINGICMGVELAGAGTGTTQPMVINVYELTSQTFILANLNLLGSQSFDLPDQTLSIQCIDFDIPVSIPSGTNYVVELYIADATATGHQFLQGANANGETAPTYIVTSPCGINEPTNLSTAAGTAIHWVLEVNACSGCPNGGTIDCYLDNDGDNFGNPNEQIIICTTCPSGYVTDNTDCDDTNPLVYPGAVLTPINTEGYQVPCSTGIVPNGEGLKAEPPYQIPSNYSNSSPLVIPNSPAGTFSAVITVPESFSISDLNVDMQITHTWIGDLDVILTAPDGITTVQLFDQPGGSGCGGCSGDNMSAIFDDNAALTANDFENTCNNLPAITGTYQPINPLSTFNGMDAQGDWTLTVTDHCNSDGGSVENWTLEFEGLEVISWWDAPTGGIQVGSGNIFDPTSIPPASGGVDINQLGVYPYWAQFDIFPSCANNERVQVDFTVEGLTYIGNVTFTSQAQLDAWDPCYTTIDGHVSIMGYYITDLSALANVSTITGNLFIYGNSQLTSLEGLNNLTSVGGSLTMYYNFQLANCCAIDDLLTNGGVVGPIQIFFNAAGCNSQADIQNSCAPAPLVGNGGNEEIGWDMNTFNDLALYPNPASNEVNVQMNRTAPTATLRVMDMLGRTVLEQELAEGIDRFSIDLGNGQFENGIYLVSLYENGEMLTKQLVVNK